jgi:S1-C subfamily serine protease
MRIHKFVIAIGLATSLVAAPSRADIDPQVLASTLRPSVVALTIKGVHRPRQEERSDETVVPAVRVNPAGIAAASGLLISADGLVLTVASLLETQGEVTATFEGGGTQRAEVVGKDRRLGVALLRVRGSIPGFVPLKNIGLPALGERMLALGRAALEDESFPVITDGIASAVGDASARTMPYIQSTVQLTPPMGGGPLVSQKTGEVVGVNAMIYFNRNAGGSMTFAVPIREFLKVKDQLIAYGKVTRAAIGISLSPVNDELRQALGLTGKDGVLISGVREGGPAALAGLRRGDIVIKADGIAVRSASAVFEAIAAGAPGEMLQLMVHRNGRSTTLSIQREELPER